ncbi:hypothetical protein SeLEV6574_g02653 [Synchytrium endobioticum]|uniref:DNA mismatch repair proteins mutS family domain-containing protein n=1 Tax=Synchytrium endobioticum TaxID=286115 RepID=A0A507D798_9FUNG|nr:hypothetical protein SeLEV6574_g02653 [Synchytrium endobioticum]
MLTARIRVVYIPRLLWPVLVGSSSCHLAHPLRPFASIVNSEAPRRTAARSSSRQPAARATQVSLKLGSAVTDTWPSSSSSSSTTTSSTESESVSVSDHDIDAPDTAFTPWPTGSFKPGSNEEPARSMTLVRRQLAQIQAIHPTAVVLLQVGSFFEIADTPGCPPYLEDVASLLNLRIARKARTTASNDDNRVAGFPVANLRRSVDVLLEHGKTVVIVEQRGRHSTKAHYLREVTRVVTPGTPLEDWEESKENHFLLSCYAEDSMAGSSGSSSSSSSSKTSSKSAVVGLAWVDVSTGEFFLGKCSLAELESTISRIQPREILFAESVKQNVSPDVTALIQNLPATWNVAVSFVDDALFDMKQSSKRLTSLLVKADPTKVLAKRISPSTESLLRNYQPSQISAAGGLLAYVIRNYAGAELVFQAPLSIDDEECMMLDASTLQALEVVSTLRDRKRMGSLLHVLDETVTAAGGRLLAARLRSPSTSLPEINRRLDLVDVFANDTHLCDELRSILKQCKDVERGIQRLHVDASSPQDFSNVIRTLALIGQIAAALQNYIRSAPNASPALSDVISRMGNFANLIDRYDGIFEQGKHDETSISEGGVVSLEFSPDIASLQKEKSKLQDERIQVAHKLYLQYICERNTRTKPEHLVEMLKVDAREGPIVEVPRAKSSTPPNATDLQSDEDCAMVLSMGGVILRRLMTARRLRFTHSDWTDLYARIGELEARRVDIERSILRDACEDLKKHIFAIGLASKAMAEIDVALGLAIIAREKQYVRPRLIEQPIHDIKGGRHPVVEVSQRERGIHFVKNDCLVGNDERIWLLTGPNMGGKSTFLRQCALMSIMAQAGSFVAADSARLGIVDAIFCRVGAADDLGRNQSTFMVEMEETATILKKATPQSFVIMDEVGRGTSTLDGLSIAYAVLVHLRDQIQCRGVFATHYHELGSLVGAIGSATTSSPTGQSTRKGIASHHTSIIVDEHGHFEYIFKILPGVMSSSHGIEVARLAGLPDSVLQTAQRVRTELQTSSVECM